ncbi:MAG: GNAT family N-acetyltransferase [Phycisphaerales bacterium]|nr:GNAT family N-acetyltransferase [Phycisphaerales bacterium]
MPTRPSPSRAAGWHSRPACRGSATRRGWPLGTDLSEQDLGILESFYADRGVTPRLELTVFVPEDTLRLLGSRGYLVEHFETVLARPLDEGLDMADLLPRGWPPGVEIRRTDPADERACRQHSSLVGSGFQTEPLSEAMIDMGVRAIRHPRSVAFMAFVENQPVAGCGMEVCDCVGTRACSLWGTTVLEPFRRRGIQQALISARLAHGISEGCRLAMIESKPGIPTERNAARLGFTPAYTRVCMAGRLQ